jgi:hypothetical protein
MGIYEKFFKETEAEKIRKELLNEILPVNTLQNYYCLGMADLLNTMYKFINNHNKQITPEEFKHIISLHVNSDERIAEYYNRLQRDNKDN